MNRSRTWIAAGSLLLMSGLWAAAPALADLSMKEGKWETTSETVMEGMPYQMPAQKIVHCVTTKDVVPVTGERRESCKILSQNIKGNTVTYKMKCADKEGTTEIEGESTYADNGASYKGNTSMRLTDKQGKTTNMKVKVAGRRIGECDASAREQAPTTYPERGTGPGLPDLRMEKPMGQDMTVSQPDEKMVSTPGPGQEAPKGKPDKSAAEKVLDAPVKGLKKLFGF
jgi:hypothetical protein